MVSADERRYIWKAPGDIWQLQIDYIMVREMYQHSVKKAIASPGTDCDSDHNLVVMQVKLRLMKVMEAGRSRNVKGKN